jgi:hypothetical protein
MKTNATRKLTLHRESLHRLEIGALGAANAAAGSKNTACPVCNLTQNSCYGTCTC